MKFEIFREQGASGSNDYRWRLRASNGEPIASSGEGYRNKSDCQHAIYLVKSTNSTTPVVDLTSSFGGLTPPNLGLLAQNVSLSSLSGINNHNRLADKIYPSIHSVIHQNGILKK